jgi:hypothetical protein
MNLDTISPNRGHVTRTVEATSNGSFDARIDAVEYGRGQLAASSFYSTSSAREVHVLRLRYAFERAGIANQLRFALIVINLMREAQELGRGYWFPTPLRVVPIDAQAILVGIAPTSELQRHFHRVARAGYARVLPEEDAQALPHQELDNWLGLKVQDSVAWSESQFEDAHAGMGPTIPSGNIQFFTTQTKRSSFGITTYPVWADASRSSFMAKQGVALCRERIGRESFRHFLGRMKGDRLVAEGPPPSDVERIQFGFAALAGEPITVSVIKRGSDSIFHVPARLPRAERQLMLALGVSEISSIGKSYRVRDGAFDAIIVARLRNLGCEMQMSRV